MSGKPAHFRGVLTRVSQARYLLWRLFGGKRTINLKLVNGTELRMRSLSTTDYYAA